MKIGILIFSDPALDNYTGVARLEETAQVLGHAVFRLYEPNFSLCGDELLYDGKQMPDVDVIISRPNFIEEPSLHFYVVNTLIENGYKVLNGKPSFAIAKNKIEQLCVFQKKGFPYPKSFITKNPESALKAAKQIGFPVVIKVAFGTIGKGVFYAPNQETFGPIVEYLAIRDRNPVIVQEFIKEADRKDLRVFIVGEKIVASMERCAPEGDVRANTSNGGTGTPVTLTDQEQKLAIQVATVFDLDIIGIDLIRSNRGPLVLEVNSNPGFSELERATGIDVAKAIIEFAVS
ncbi:RimK family alpha-L-glutamate ligase [Candidatus Uhrbacteria bacterium]|nr:RimK family alpha-L-glutamate ligase [Candidatus Uhrbacteria bacterium]